MPEVEFVPEDDDPGSSEPRHAAHRAPLTRRGVSPRALLVAGAAAAAVVAVAVVVTQRTPGSDRPAAVATSSAGSHTSSSRPAPSTSVATLALPEQLAFGPDTQSLLAVGNRIFGLTSHLIGAVQRDGGSLVVRPTTAGRMTGSPRLELDEARHLVWAVEIGGTAIGSFDTGQLATRDDQKAPGTIVSATPMAGRLWFVTAAGLYRIAPGDRAATLVAAQRGLVAVAADPTRNRVVVVGEPGITSWSAGGSRGITAPLPFRHADDVAVVAGQVWITGHDTTNGLLFHISPTDLHPAGPVAATGSSVDPAVIATYADRLIVSGVGPAGTMSCVLAGTGRVLQTFPYPRGAAVAVNERGLLVSAGRGIELRNARDCLAGT